VPLLRRPTAIIVAVGLLAVGAGTAGLLSRHSTLAMRLPPRGVATVPAPAGPIAPASWMAPMPQVAPVAQVASGPQANLAPRPARHQPVRPRPASQSAPRPVARPVTLTIPLIGVKTPLVTLGLAADGTLQVPASTAMAGWYTGSARPGSIGPAVIVGHVDSLSGPGVFFRLSELRPGDRVYVTRADGTTVEFRVTLVQVDLKADFPTQAVYAATADSELRLITCGGAFDYQSGRYLSNVIVYGTQVG
jgi:LPXTG-site transpeptidase (sortase) family protein